MKRRTGKSAASTLSTGPVAVASGKKNKAAKLKRRLLKYEELPEYLKDNEFILDYYRCEWPLKDVILSVFSLHNETLNIWTHLVGFVIFLGLTVMSLTEKMRDKAISGLFGEGSDGWMKTKMMNQSNGSNALFSDSYLKDIPSAFSNPSNPLPLWPWFIFLMGSMCCLSFSTISHLFASHSRRFYYFFWRLDYVGISIMIISSFFAPIYYTFSDQPNYLILYLSSITLLGILVVITLLAPSLSDARFRSFRASLFLCMGFSGVIPASHAVILYWNDPLVLGALGYEVVMGVLYGVGAVFYVSRIPERWKPGAFDIVGHSHQIFHVLVVAAAVAHSCATLIVMEWRMRLSI